MKYLKPHKGDYNNRHLDGLPKNGATIMILTDEGGNEDGRYLCEWQERKEDAEAAEGYLGTAVRLTGIPIGWDVWEQNNSEFIFWKLIS